MSGLDLRDGASRSMGRRSLLGASVALFLGGFAGCNPRASANQPPLAAAKDNTTLGPGDIFQLEIVGETNLPKEYQVAADGTVTLPYIRVVEVAGLEPHEVARRVREKLIEGQIRNDPSVVVTVKEYRSKRVTVLGQVRNPGSFPITPGLSLLQAISLAGGLTAIANPGKVNLTREASGQSRTVVFNVELIYEGKSEDVLLQPGDRIFVHERVF